MRFWLSAANEFAGARLGAADQAPPAELYKAI